MRPQWLLLLVWKTIQFWRESSPRPISKARKVLQCCRPNTARKPHIAPNPRKTMNATPSTRPDMVLLLQPWSTATTHITNNNMAMPPRTLSHMIRSPRFAPKSPVSKDCSSMVAQHRRRGSDGSHTMVFNFPALLSSGASCALDSSSPRTSRKETGSLASLEI